MAGKAAVYAIFVARLPWTVCRDRLAQHFKTYGEIVSSRVAFNWNTGLSKGYGFVHFKDQASVDSALRASHEMQGARIEVKPLKQEFPEQSEDTDDTKEEIH
eukprot:m.308743 g.308743  ORF g.308743 m.308743 type:complete len:102 (+) comp44665_c0_seq1:20-325(+)